MVVLVVEGPPSSGKTRWVSEHAGDRIVVGAQWADEYTADSFFKAWVAGVKRAMAKSPGRGVVCDTGPLDIKLYFPNWTVPEVPFPYETLILSVETSTLWMRIQARALRESAEDPETHAAREACGENSRESLEKAVAFFKNI
jgi:hypothetical protein